MSDEATGVLRDEHRTILRVVGAFEGLLAGGGPAPGAQAERAAECVRFFRLFADLCHHAKEEDLLFDELVEAGFSREAGPVAVMLYEHTLARGHVGAMAEELDGVRSGDPGALARFRQAAVDYIELIRAHILKEDNVLFTMADRALDAPACARLCEAYDEACVRRFEGCTKSELEELAERIVGGD
ncbi:MAG: hemerythrin [Gemmatimonadetes bacterium]|nr:MAG: hemerythrin [Gemmatimonadota bacterium]